MFGVSYHRIRVNSGSAFSPNSQFNDTYCPLLRYGTAKPAGVSSYFNTPSTTMGFFFASKEKDPPEKPLPNFEKYSSNIDNYFAKNTP